MFVTFRNRKKEVADFKLTSSKKNTMLNEILKKREHDIINFTIQQKDIQIKFMRISQKFILLLKRRLLTK